MAFKCLTEVWIRFWLLCSHSKPKTAWPSSHKMHNEDHADWHNKKLTNSFDTCLEPSWTGEHRFTGEHPCRSVISKKLLCNFIEITLRHGCHSVNLLHIFRTPFYKNTYGEVLHTLLFYTLWRLFLVFSGGMEGGQWHEIGCFVCV